MSGDDIQVSHAYKILQPKSGDAIPVPTREWAELKSRILRASDEPWLFQTLGSAILGIAAATLLPIATNAVDLPNDRSLEIHYMVLAVCTILGICLIGLGQQQKRDKKERASDVATLMDSIESRYESGG